MTSKKNICFLLYSMTGGGEERIASIMLRELHQEFNIHLLLFNGPIEYELPQGVKAVFLRNDYRYRWVRLLTLPFVFFRLRRYCVQHQIRIILSFDTLANVISCLVQRSYLTLKIWLREMNYVSERYSTKQVSGRVHRKLIKKLYPRADKVFVNAARIKEDLINNYDLKSELISITLNPVDVNIMAARIKPAADHSFKFIHVGAFRPQKNHALLISAFEHLKHLNVELWLVGQGPLNDSVRKQVHDLGLDKHVQFWGFQKDPFELMSQADCMVLSSDFEGLPNVLIEGLACGLPIIATDCPTGPREILCPDSNTESKSKGSVTIAKYGLLVPPNHAIALAQAMRLMIDDRALRESYKQIVRQSVLHYDTASVISKFKKLLSKV